MPRTKKKAAMSAPIVSLLPRMGARSYRGSEIVSRVAKIARPLSLASRTPGRCDANSASAKHNRMCDYVAGPARRRDLEAVAPEHIQLEGSPARSIQPQATEMLP